MLSINFPEKFTPGLTDNFVSNEVVLKDLDFDKSLTVCLTLVNGKLITKIHQTYTCITKTLLF